MWPSSASTEGRPCLFALLPATRSAIIAAMRLLVLVPVMLFACGGDPHAEDGDISAGDTSRDTSNPDTNDVSDTVDLGTEVDEDTGPAPSDIADSLEAPDTTDALEAPDTTDALEAPDTIDTPDTNASPDTVDTADSDTAHDLIGPDAVSDTDTTATDIAEVTTCPSSILIESHPVLPSPYVPVCSEVDYPTDPPTSGPHYPVWATYKTYLAPINPGFLVHSLKHGAIVITWRCPDGCADDLTALRELINQRPQDPRCDSLLYHRIVVAPRPDQDRTLVASAWGHSFKADCFDLPALTAFIDAHYGQGLEDDCFEGVDVEKIRPDNLWYCPP